MAGWFEHPKKRRSRSRRPAFETLEVLTLLSAGPISSAVSVARGAVVGGLSPISHSGMRESIAQIRAVLGLAQTRTGWYYPTNRVLTDNGNWLACGRSYYPNERHIGTDISAALGASVYAIGPGKVIARSSNGWGTGNYALAIRHSSASGDFVAVYGHIRTTLGVGANVHGGDKIGTIGPWSAGNHLHFGIRPGSNVPPTPWGKMTDINCGNSGATNGFVAPISWINSKSPRT